MGLSKKKNVKKNLKKEEKAMSISLYGNLFFVIAELVIAVWTGSQSVLLDSVYDGIEFLMLLPSVFIIPLLYKPANEKHPFGYMQMESMFVVVKGILMVSVTVGLIANNINIIINGGKIVNFLFVGIFDFIAFVICGLVAILLNKKSKKLNSQLIKAEMQCWKIDSVLSLGMAVAFFIPVIFKNDFILNISYYLDSVITIILSMIMLPSPIKIIVSGLRDLMLIPPNEEVVNQIKEIVEPIIYKSKCVSCEYDIVKTGRKLWISAYINLNKDELSVSRLHELQAECIVALEEKFSSFYFELLPNIIIEKEELILKEENK